MSLVSLDSKCLQKIRNVFINLCRLLLNIYRISGTVRHTEYTKFNTALWTEANACVIQGNPKNNVLGIFNKLTKTCGGIRLEKEAELGHQKNCSLG